MRRYHWRASHHLFPWAWQPDRDGEKQQGGCASGFSGFQSIDTWLRRKRIQGHPEHGGEYFQRTGGRWNRKTLSERFGKVLQQRQSISINRQDVSTSINTQLDSLIPASKIANLSQGTFVGAVADNFDERIEQKIFHAEIVVDHTKISAEEKAYQKIPLINDFKDRNGNDIMMQQIQRNYDQIKADAQAIINEEMRRIKNDPELCKRLGLEDEKGNDPDKSWQVEG